MKRFSPQFYDYWTINKIHQENRSVQADVKGKELVKEVYFVKMFYRSTQCAVVAGCCSAHFLNIVKYPCVG